MAEAVEHVATTDHTGRRAAGVGRSAKGRRECRRAVWAPRIVVRHVQTERALQMPPARDQQVVQTLLSHGPNPALGDRVRLRRLLRRRVLIAEAI